MLSTTFTDTYGTDFDGSDLHMVADHTLWTYESATQDCIKLAAQIAERAAQYDPNFPAMLNIPGLARDLATAETKRTATREAIGSIAFLLRRTNEAKEA
jgi:hypothetical protein